jgi:hypothetical protein
MKRASLLLLLVFILTSLVQAQDTSPQAPSSATGPSTHGQMHREHHQKMMEMHQQHMETMKADMAKMRSSLGR